MIAWHYAGLFCYDLKLDYLEKLITMMKLQFLCQ